MKNILIIGVARSGKSRLAKKLREGKDYNHIPMDYFTSSLKHNFESTNITSNVVIDKTSSKNLSILLSRVIEIIDDTDEKFIIDSAHLYPEDIMKYINKDKWDVYCLGYPNTTKEEKLKEIRIYDDINDWTYKRTDEELLEIIANLIEISKELQEQSQKLNINFIDTSKNLL